MLTIAQLAAAVAAASLGSLTDQDIVDARYTVMFAIDPAAIGDEPHLRCEVDTCGLDEDALHALDRAVCEESGLREDARWAAQDAARREIMIDFDMLPLAA